MRAAIVVIALLASAVARLAAQDTVLVAQPPAIPAANKWSLSRDVFKVLDSLADDARENHREGAACLADYAVKDSTLYLTRLIPAKMQSANDTSAVFACPIGMPTLHSHIPPYGSNPPSDADVHASVELGIWCLLLHILPNGYYLTVY